MDDEEPFFARTPWNGARPQALALCCSDGRWHPAMVEFLAHKGLDRADLYVVPGGPACYDSWASSPTDAAAFDSAFRLLMEHHDIRSIWLVAHEGCAYYRVRHPLVPAEQIEVVQREDLLNARDLLLRRYPALDVSCVIANLVEGSAKFTPVVRRARR
jgi:hypothetical protein